MLPNVSTTVKCSILKFQKANGAFVEDFNTLTGFDDKDAVLYTIMLSFHFQILRIKQSPLKKPKVIIQPWAFYRCNCSSNCRNINHNHVVSTANIEMVLFQMSEPSALCKKAAMNFIDLARSIL